MKIKHIRNNDYNLNILQTTKFKTTRINITFANDLTKETSTKRALLPYLMRAVSKKFPKRTLMQIHLENMYSAHFNSGVKKVGLSQHLSFDLSFIDNQYTFQKEDLFLGALEFLHEVLFYPLFTEEIFKEEKRLLQEYFQGIYANKMRYAIKEALHNMYHGEAYNIDAFGNEDDLKQLTLEDCKNAYYEMIDSDLININVVGNVDFNEVEQKIRKVFHFNERHKHLTFIDTSKKDDKEHQVILESQNVNQAKLVIGYQFPVYYGTNEYYQAVVLNTLVGGGAESLLFKKVREELSLVYFIGSAYDQNKGSLVIYSGINQNHYQQVVQEIEQVLHTIQTMQYEEKFLIIAKKAIISGLLQSFDSSSSLISRVNSLSLFHKTLDTNELIEKINHVTKEELSTLLKRLKRDTTYLLRNDALENN